MSVFTGKLKEFFSGYEVLKSYNRIENAVSQFQTDDHRYLRGGISGACRQDHNGNLVSARPA